MWNASQLMQYFIAVPLHIKCPGLPPTLAPTYTVGKERKHRAGLRARTIAATRKMPHALPILLRLYKHSNVKHIDPRVTATVPLQAGAQVRGTIPSGITAHPA